MTLLDEYYAAKAARNNYNRHPLDNGKPILSPLDTELRIQARIRESDYLLKPNTNHEYILGFFPFTSYDAQRLDSKIEEVLSHWERSKGFMIDKTPYHNILDKYDMYVCNQLFAPKVNHIEDTDYYGASLGWEARIADLSLHFRDAPDGQIYLQCSYCDLYEKEEKPVIEYTGLDDDGIDF